MKKIILSSILFCTGMLLMAQTVTVHIDQPQQPFYGGGGTIDGYLAHWNSMSKENRMKAAKWLTKDINLDYVKNYVNGTVEGSIDNYEKFIMAVNDLRVYNPDIKVQLCLNDLPDHLEMKDKNGENMKSMQDESIPDVYEKIAQHFFDMLVAFKERGVDVAQFDMLNEPGGLDVAVHHGKKFAYSIPILKKMIADPAINTIGVKMPEVLGVSHWGVEATVKWFNVWKEQLPEAYEQVDVVSTHGYEGGWIESNYRAIYEYIDGKPFMNNEQTGKMQVGDKIFEQFNNTAPPYVGDITIATHISDAINGGVNHFFVFQLGNPSGNNAGLLKTPYNGEPSKSDIYAGYKQLTSMQPDSSHCLGRTISNVGDCRVLCFRKDQQDTIYVHITNIRSKSELFTIDVNNALGQGLGIRSVTTTVSDREHDEEVVLSQIYTQSVEAVQIPITPHSVTSLKILLDKVTTGKPLHAQTINFESISTIERGIPMDLNATATSGLPVTLEIVEGEATIADGKVIIDKPGNVVLRASQSGSEIYAAAKEVRQTLTLHPQGKNIALGKAVVTSTDFNSKYIGANIVDGNMTDNASRWVCAKGESFPQDVVIDLGEPTEINAVRYYLGLSGYNQFISAFQIQAWVNGTWRTVLTETDNTQAVYVGSFPTVTTTKVRLNMTGGGAMPIRMYELELFSPEGSGIEMGEMNEKVRLWKDQDVMRVLSDALIEDVMVYSVDGRLILGEVDVNASECVLSIGEFTSNVYVVRVVTDQGIVVKRIIK